MTHQTFTVTDPREFAGDPYEVAELSVAQIIGLLGLVDSLMFRTKLMVRNAEMERRLHRGDPADAGGWDESAEGRKWATLEAELSQLAKLLETLRRAAGFDPRKMG